MFAMGPICSMGKHGMPEAQREQHPALESCKVQRQREGQGQASVIMH